MTVVASWIRKINTKKDICELVMISDSRLNNAMFWDECPKLMTFERGDCVLGFAGNTAFSYPLMIQTSNAIKEYAKIQKGAVGLDDFAGHFVRVMNRMTKSIRNDIVPIRTENLFEPYSNEYILAGYDWLRKRFCIKTVSCIVENNNKKILASEVGDDATLLSYGDYNQVIKYGLTDYRFAYYEQPKKKIARVWEKGQNHYKNFENHFGEIAVIGDMRDDYIGILKKIMKKKYGENYEFADGTFDMEPYDALCELLEKEGPRSTVGGAPQMVKVYQYLSSGILGVYWPERDEGNPFANRTILGRKLLEYENTDYWFWDRNAQRSFPCRDGMNEYIDMFQNISICYEYQEDGYVKVSVKKSNEEYMKNCNFKVKGNADKLSCGDSYKLQLKYINNGEFHLFPMSDLKRYTVPSRALFEKHRIYETRAKLTDMFDVVKFKYVYKEGNVYIQLENNKGEYAKYCDFKILDEKDMYKPNEEFFIELEYNEAGIIELGIEPSIYIKKCKVPIKKVLEELEVRKLLIKKFISCIKA